MTGRHIPPLPATLVLALGVHWWLWSLTCTDVDTFLLPWFQHIQTTGAIHAFAEPFANYAPPYLYLLAFASLFDAWIQPLDLIKALSVAGSVALTGAVWHLLRTLRHPPLNPIASAGPVDQLKAAAVMLILPTTVINAAVMSQCDAMWAAACIMALAAAVARRHAAMLIWCGVAVAFKLQAAFFAPFVLALLIRRRVPFHLWPIAALVWIASLIPAWLIGWPAADLLTIYLKQTDFDPGLALNAPNIWIIAETLAPHLPLTALALTAAIGASAAYVARISIGPLSERRLMEAAMLAPMIVVGLLPRMHERYFFLADVIACAIALTWPDRRSIGLAALVQLGSTLALLAYLSGITGLAMLGAVPMIVATIVLARPLWEHAANDNPFTSRAAA